MATKRQLLETALLTLFFLGIVGGLAYVRGQYGTNAGFLVEPTFVVIALAPFLFFLAATGQLKRFKGGGFEIILREHARKVVSLDARRDPIEVKAEETHRKEGLEELERKQQEGDLPTALAFRLEEDDYYDKGAIEEYIHVLSKNPDFRFVVFNDSDGRFRGYMHVEDFDELLNSDVDVVAELESGEMLDRAGVNRAAVDLDSSNQEALREMDKHDVNELAVVNTTKTFVGVVTQEGLVRKILTNAVRDV